MRAPVLALLALLAAAPSAHAAAVTVQADAQHSGYVERGGPRLPLSRAWVAPLEHRVGYPVIAEGKAFVVTAPRLGHAPRVVALSLRDGRRVWERDLSGETLPSDAAIAYDAGRLFVTRDVYYEPRDSAMLALSPADGRVLWETGENLSLFDAVPPVAVDGVVYLSETGGGTGGISAWRQEDGANLWRVSSHHGGGGSPAVAGDVVATGVGCEPQLFRVRRDGTPLGPTSSSCTSGSGYTPVVAGPVALLHGDPDDQAVYDLATSARLAPLDTDDIPAVGRGVTLVTDARIPGEEFRRGHTLIALRADGRRMWRFRGDGYLDSAPLIAGGTAYVGSGSGRVYALDLRTGRVRSRAGAGASVLAMDPDRLAAGLAAGEGLLLVPARGRLVAFR
jgi:outer membrane protein assembly factor BamB